MRYHQQSTTKRRVMAVVVAGLLAFGPAVPALGEESELEQLQNEAIAAGEAYDEAQQKVDELQQQIDANQSKVDELNEELPAMRQSAGKAIRTQYRLSQDQPNIIGMLLSSEDLSQFIAQLHYLDAVASSNTDAINDLAEAQEQLNVTQAQLNADLEAADAQKQAAKQALDDAQQKAAAAEQKAQEEAAANQAAYEAQQAAGEEDPTIAEAQPSTDASTSSEGDTTDSSDSGPAADSPTSSTDSSSGQAASSQASSPDTGSTSDQGASSSAGSSAQASSGSSAASSSSASSSSSSSSGSSTSSASYTYVLASMYGEGDGLMYSATASGDVVTPTSMGVAMKTMPLGTVIEITYNGRTCTAVVNDRGPYAGNRQIDLQPAVASKLGFDGVGTVGYRVVG